MMSSSDTCGQLCPALVSNSIVHQRSSRLSLPVAECPLMWVVGVASVGVSRPSVRGRRARTRTTVCVRQECRLRVPVQCG